MPLRAVVFDLDGLLLNTEELYEHVGGELLRRRGCEMDGDLLTAMMGRPPAIALQMMIDRHKLTDSIPVLATETQAIFADLLDQRLAPMPGAAKLLDAVEAGGVPKAIATSSPRRFVLDVLGRLGWVTRFEFMLTSEDVQQGKPHPEIYLSAAARLGHAPGDVMVLEDSQNGCLAAVAAGTFAVAVPSGHSLTHDFSGAALIADTLADPRIYTALGLRHAY